MPQAVGSKRGSEQETGNMGEREPLRALVEARPQKGQLEADPSCPLLWTFFYQVDTPNPEARGISPSPWKSPAQAHGAAFGMGNGPVQKTPVS